MASRTDRIRTTGTVLLDILAITGSYWSAPALRNLLDPLLQDIAGTWTYDRQAYGLFLIPVIACTLLSLWGLGCYEHSRGQKLLSAATRIVTALVVSHLILTLLTFYLKADFMSRGVMLIFLSFNFACLFTVRIITTMATKSAPGRRTIVAGTGEYAVEMADVLSREEDHDIVGFLDIGEARHIQDARVLGRVSDTARILNDYTPVDEIALATRDLRDAQAAVDAAEERGIAVRQLLPPLATGLHKVRFEHISGLNMLTMNASAAGGMGLSVKRLVDIVGSIFGLMATGLLCPFVAIAIKLDSRGPSSTRKTGRV